MGGGVTYFLGFSLLRDESWNDWGRSFQTTIVESSCVGKCVPFETKLGVISSSNALVFLLFLRRWRWFRERL